MSVSISRFSWWFWSNGKEKEPIISSGSSSDSMKLSSLKKKGTNLSSSSSTSSSLKKVKKKWQSREERMRRVVDKEYDVVLVPSDGVCLSASEESSYDSDWSIGWMEPHAHEFLQSDSDSDSDDVSDNSFAVLVPCYRNDCKAFKMEMEEEEPSNQLLSVLNKLPNGFPAANEGNKYMDQWLASLQNL